MSDCIGSNGGPKANVSMFDQLAYAGKVWTSRRSITIPGGESNIAFDPTAGVTSVTRLMILPPEFQSIGGDVVIITAFFAATYSGGVVLPAINRNQYFPAAAKTVLKNGVTIVSPGLEGPQWQLGSDAVGASSAVGGKAGSQLMFIGNPSLITRIRINNTDTSSQKLEYNLTWIEI